MIIYDEAGWETSVWESTEWDGDRLVVKNLVKNGVKDLLRSIVDRWNRFTLTPELIVRIRFVLFLIALLTLFLAFQVGDDWYVRTFANYDWARHIGY